MKTMTLTVLACLLAVTSVLGAGGEPVDRPDPSNLFIKIVQPTPLPVLWVRNPYIRVGGVAAPSGLLEKVTYTTSAGASGDCILTNRTALSNCVESLRCQAVHFVTPALALDPGSNMITVVAVPNDPQIDPASDSLLVYYNAVTNHRPRIVSRPPRWWGTNETYSYTLRAADLDNDPLRLQLDTFGPVMATVTELENGVWHISAALTTTVTPRRVAFRAVVTDGLTRPATQRWSVWCRKPWRFIQRRIRLRTSR